MKSPFVPNWSWSDGVVEVFVWINEQKRIEVVLRKRASASALRDRGAVRQRTTPPGRLRFPNESAASHARLPVAVALRTSAPLACRLSARGARPYCCPCLPTTASSDVYMVRMYTRPSWQ